MNKQNKGGDGSRGGSKLPPRMSMEEYIDFVDESMRHADPEKIAKIKAVQKDIKVRFYL